MIEKCEHDYYFEYTKQCLAEGIFIEIWKCKKCGDVDYRVALDSDW